MPFAEGLAVMKAWGLHLQEPLFGTRHERTVGLTGVAWGSISGM
jgi:hypothetical protein